jgi:FolB domain-containing protein
VQYAAGGSIRIEQLEISARIGVTAEERAQPQRITVNITVWPNAPFEQLHDDIARTINYVELCRTIREIVESREWNLIETVASDLSSQLVETFPIETVEVEVRKFVLPNTAFVSATSRKTNR